MVAVWADGGLPAAAQSQTRTHAGTGATDERFARPGAMPSFVKSIRAWLARTGAIAREPQPAARSGGTAAAKGAAKGAAGPKPAGPKPEAPEPTAPPPASAPPKPATQKPAPTKPALARPDAAPVAPADRPAPAGPREAGCTGERVIAAFYWQGTRTANGERFDPHGLTAAHRTLPFGTRLTVTNPHTGRSVEVTINDRGPFVRGVSIDLSLGAARAIGMTGTGAVCIL